MGNSHVYTSLYIRQLGMDGARINIKLPIYTTLNYICKNSKVTTLKSQKFRKIRKTHIIITV